MGVIEHSRACSAQPEWRHLSSQGAAMTALILGLIVFLGVHSMRVAGEAQRTALMQRLGEGGYKGVYSLASGLGLALIVWGYSVARLSPVPLWTPMVWPRHLAMLLTLLAFILLAAAYVPGNGIKARLHHPMVLGIKSWALAHLLANHTLADLLLFGGFLVWAALSFRAARARDRAEGKVYPAGTLAMTLSTVVVGSAAWAGFALWLHRAWLGVAPMG
jgi:uncharacterized membrane protein